MLTEKKATEQFVSGIPTEYFYVHKQCRGEAIYVKKLKRLFASWDKRPVPTHGIVDFILEPTKLLMEHGWEIGCVGVEIKSSFAIENRPGRAIVQILDYQSCSYSLPSGKTELSMIFLFPYRQTACYIASTMQQEGLGFVRYEPKYEARFQLLQANTSNEPVFTCFANGTYRLGNLGMGRNSDIDSSRCSERLHNITLERDREKPLHVFKSEMLLQKCETHLYSWKKDQT